MAFLGGLFGGGGDKAAAEQNQPREYTTSADLFANANFPKEHVHTASHDAGPSHIPQPPSSQPQPQQPASSQGQIQLPSALDTFSSAYDPARLHPLAGLGDKLDFLQLDEDKLTDMQGASSVLPSRGWTDDLCVGTGTTYVSGLAIGGAWGVKEGWSRQLGENASGKLRLNSILNGATRRGTLLGNSLGVLAIFYNLTNSGLDAIRGQHDVFNSMGAAALSGAVFKSTAGARPAAITAGVMAGAAGAWSVFKTWV